MSDFVQQQSVECRFDSSDSWVILSPIEQSIKRKIESVGTPLKDWDIQINYGIKTGFNDAFIISTEKRNEILDNCSSDDERTKTAELIRPILRGRDIVRYGYNWADLWLIATFPSRHYDIEEFPAVKTYLLSYGKERLEQTGKKYIINGEEVKARKKTNNKWYETQDSISYWDDFNKPKIVWNRIASVKQFGLVESGIYIQDSMHFIIGFNINYLCSILNSRLIQWLLSLIIGEAAGGNAGNADNIWNLNIPYTDSDSKLTDREVYSLYNLTEDEIKYVEK